MDAQQLKKKTFSKWVHLKLPGLSLNDDITVTFSSGAKLKSLIKYLIGIKVPDTEANNSIAGKTNTVKRCLQVLQDRGLTVGHINPEGIVRKELEATLNLVWLFIEYSLSLQPWEDEFNKDKWSPKDKLLRWIQSKIPEVPIFNFTTCWNDGIAIGALVDAIAPGINPDWSDARPPLLKIMAAMDAADRFLHIEQLFDPSEMCKPEVDAYSVVTYLSLIRDAKLRRDPTPFQPKIYPNRIRLYGPGIVEHGSNTVNNPARFMVDMKACGECEACEAGGLQVQIKDPHDMEVACTMMQLNERLCNCVYMPTKEGIHRVQLWYSGHPIGRIYPVNVYEKSGNVAMVTVAGAGVEENCPIGTACFKVNAEGAGIGVVNVAILKLPEREPITSMIKRTSENNWEVAYKSEPGKIYKIFIFYGGEQTPLSPYLVKMPGVFENPPDQVLATLDDIKYGAAQYSLSAPPAPLDCRITGNGTQSKCVRCNMETHFKVHTEKAGDGFVDFKVVDPKGKMIETSRPISVESNTFQCSYNPRLSGTHNVLINYGAIPILGSPFEVEVGGAIMSFKSAPIDIGPPLKNVEASGCGLKEGMVGELATFTVKTSGGDGLRIHFTGDCPPMPTIYMKNGTYDVRYFPLKPGKLQIHISYYGQPIPNSPFEVEITDSDYSTYDGEKKTYFVGSSYYMEGQVTEQQVMELAISQLHVDSRRKENCLLRRSTDGYLVVGFNALDAGKYEIDILGLGYPPPTLMLEVDETNIANANKVEVWGKGLVSGIVNKDNEFFVNFYGAGRGGLTVSLDGPIEDFASTCFITNAGYKSHVTYKVTELGIYKLHIMFAGDNIRGSPFKVRIGAC